MYDQTLPFYLGRTTTLVDYRDELGPGLDAEPRRGIAHEADWIAAWRSLAQGYALMAPDTARIARGRRRSDAGRRRATRGACSSQGAEDGHAMTSSAFLFLMTGVLLNAGAQLLLKGGHQSARRHHADRATTGSTMLMRMATQGTSSPAPRSTC